MIIAIQTYLARALLTMVFTKDALKKCLLFGKKAYGLVRTGEVKPEIFETAVEFIFGA